MDLTKTLDFGSKMMMWLTQPLKADYRLIHMGKCSDLSSCGMRVRSKMEKMNHKVLIKEEWLMSFWLQLSNYPTETFLSTIKTCVRFSCLLLPGMKWTDLLLFKVLRITLALFLCCNHNEWKKSKRGAPLRKRRSQIITLKRLWRFPFDCGKSKLIVLFSLP